MEFGQREHSMFREMTVQGPRPAPVMFSVAAHACVLALALLAPRAGDLAEKKPKSLYEALIKPNEKKLIWYRFDTKLPEVTASDSKDVRPPRIDQVKKEQTVVTRGEKRSRQMTMLDAPEVKPQAELKAPNLLAFEAPKIPDPPPQPKPFEAPRLTMPPPGELPAPPEIRETFEARQSPLPEVKGPPPRKFEAPAEKARRQQQLELAEAPQLESDALARSSPLPDPQRPVKAFVAPKAKPVEQALLPVPVASSARGGDVSGMAIPIDSPRAQARKFTLPARRGPAGAGELASAGVPGLAAGPIGSGPALPVPQRPLPRPFSLPQNQIPAPGTAIVLDADSVKPGTGSDAATAAVISTAPSAITSPVLPEGNLSGAIASGPKLNPEGGTGDRVETARVTMPGLTIRNPGTSPAPPLRSAIPMAMVQVAPTSAENLRAIARATAATSQPEPAAEEPSMPGVRVAPTPPASYLRGRTVYSMSVQAPNVTSYSGSWMVWFAERINGGPGLRPPGAIRKVDPVYAPSAMDERVEGNVRLAGVLKTDGTVSQISVVNGVDDRLDQSAIVAFSKWQFEPAQRDGQPIELDIVVEIPFRLAPRHNK